MDRDFKVCVRPGVLLLQVGLLILVAGVLEVDTWQTLDFDVIQKQVVPFVIVQSAWWVHAIANCLGHK
jgi:hypothetical protein